MAPEALTIAAAGELRPVDPQVWKACAGTAASVASVGSRVYYFPQGHAEHSADFPSDFGFSRPFVLCRVAAVRLLADASDEVFVSVRLEPVRPAGFAATAAAAAAATPPRPLQASFSFPSPASAAEVGTEVGENGKPGGGFIHFAKTLTRSDANNGGGFSVPRFCADSIFPPLSYDVETPVQTIFVRDIHGKPWEFRHIYRGTPRRHLLTTGWSRFVNDKSLMAGDSVVFVRNAAEELFVGIRRTLRSCAPMDIDFPSFSSLDNGEKKLDQNHGCPKSSRNRVAASSVLEAVRLAEMNLEFEVMYYPRAGLPEFLVSEKEVETATSVYWATGMRVRMSVEAEDSARMSWFHGTVSYVATKNAGPWPCSPWRMLEVTWDEPNILQNIKSINPWQVELVSATTHIQAPLVSSNTQIQLPFHVLKRMKTDGELFDMANFKSKNLGGYLPPYNYTSFPAGMQGARHDSTNVSSFFNLKDMSSSSILSGISTANDTKVCTELNIGSIGSIGSNSPSEGTSPPSQESTIESGLKILRPLACRPTKKVNKGSFQLFGQIIEIEKPNDALDRLW